MIVLCMVTIHITKGLAMIILSVFMVHTIDTHHALLTTYILHSSLLTLQSSYKLLEINLLMPALILSKSGVN